jgi:hypothetical protein
LGEDIGEEPELKVKEFKNGWMAMKNMFGMYVQKLVA